MLLCQWVLYNTTLSPWKGQRVDLSTVQVALHIHKQKFSRALISLTATLGVTRGPAAQQWFLTLSHQCREHPRPCTLGCCTAACSTWQDWVMHCKYQYIPSYDRSAREDWTLILAITHGSSYLSKFQEMTIRTEKAWLTRHLRSTGKEQIFQRYIITQIC